MRVIFKKSSIMKKIYYILLFVLFVNFYYLQKTHAQSLSGPNVPCLSANLIVLVDKSSSMQGTEFSSCYLVQSILGNLPINEKQIWFGIGTFGDTCKIEPLSGSNYEEIFFTCAMICQAPADQGSTFLSDELLLVPISFEEARKKRGVDVSNILVIISDGNFSQPSATEKYIEIIKEKQIEIFSVVLDPDSRESIYKMMKISSSEDHYSYASVDKIVSSIIKRAGCP